MKKKILFLSSANLTTNPRLLKELKYAVELGYEVDFVGFDLNTWSDEIDKEINKDIPAEFTYLPVTRKSPVTWLLSSFAERFSRKTAFLFRKSVKIHAFAHSKRTWLLSRQLKACRKKYDLIAAHTLPALYPAYRLARRQNIPFVFDIEDYHPGEAAADKNEINRRKFLMKKLLPEANFLTYASPLIGKESLGLLNHYPESKHRLINNCFSQKEFEYKENHSGKVKFVWFSQNIAAGRGLELVIPALYKFKDKIELHLIGNLYQNFYDEYLAQYSDILSIHKPLPQKELNLKLSEYDVGLAVELNTADFNRQICLTNKIWAYFQSGLYILATDTPAQRQFVNEKETIGLIAQQNIHSFKQSVMHIIESIDSFRRDKQNRFNKAKHSAWESERQKLKEIWENINHRGHIVSHRKTMNQQKTK